jgi:tetratricopeptide (TPR) repeat protein
MAEGHLYCEKCGAEIQMVPDFEPEIENSITETLSTVAEEIEGTASDKEINNTQNDSGDKGSREFQKNKLYEFFLKKEQRRGWLIIKLTSFAVVILAAAFVTVSLYHRFSATYQIGQAREYAGRGEYERAVTFLEQARILEGDAFEIVLLEATYYYKMGEKQKAADLLIKSIRNKHLTYEEEERAYENIIAIYDEEKRYEDIASLLSACGNEEIVNHFQKYMAFSPEFGYASGDYDEVILLTMSANTAGKIYYTTDGSNPDEKSEVYTAPLFLESGEYQIAAMFVNDYGIKSDIVRNWYMINLTVPDAPEVFLASGDYDIPTMIEVGTNETGTVYYTTDGSDPGKDSLQYTGPVAMPLGKSNFKFVTISPEGVSSEIVSRSFDFTLKTDVTVGKAIDNVVKALYDRKVLTDLQGHSTEIKGKYVFQYDTIVEIADLGYYYVLNEYIDGDNGVRTKTDRLYAVEVYTGAPNRLTYDENGQMGLISLRNQVN